MEQSLLERLQAYAASGHYPFHMPGHKRNPAVSYLPAEIDITEIEGFDNLHNAKSVLKESQERAAALYGADSSFFLVNGSTAGILAAVSAAVSAGGSILMARNSHKSAYHGVYLRNLKPVYLFPEIFEKWGICGGISPKQVEEKLQMAPEIEAVLVTSPTYEGMVSNIKEIADITHRHGKILIVDEAHGAHLGFCKAFPKGALSQGADIVVQSLHKTLPSLTQTAILHVKGDRVSISALKKFLQIYQTSSPSYVLMAGMDSCIRLLEKEKERLFEMYTKRLERFYVSVKTLKRLQVIQPKEAAGMAAVVAMDPSKICCMAPLGMTGMELYKALLENYHLQMEMAAGNYVLAMSSVMDTEEGFRRLQNALFCLDEELVRKEDGSRGLHSGVAAVSAADRCCLSTAAGEYKPEVVYSPAEADSYSAERIAERDSEGRTSLEYRYAYPPGVPVLVPGERITAQVLQLLCSGREQGLDILGEEGRPGEICVCCRE